MVVALYGNGHMADTVSPETRSKIMAKIKGSNTTPEVIVRRLLHKKGFRYRLHRKDLPGSPDLVLSKYRAVVFVDGCLWHGHNCKTWHRPKSNTAYWRKKIAANKERDQKQTDELRRRGWNVIRVWECQTKDEETMQAVLLRGLRKQALNANE